MESFVHLRKGRTPKRLHADLVGLKNSAVADSPAAPRTSTDDTTPPPTAFPVRCGSSTCCRIS